MEWSQQIPSLPAQHHSKKPYYPTSKSSPPPCYLHLLLSLLWPHPYLTHLLLEQFPISIHILIHLPSKLFLDFLSTFINARFNLSLLIFVGFQTPFLCIFISSYQHPFLSTLLSLSGSFYLIVPAHIFLGSDLLLALSHKILLRFQPLPVSPVPTCAQHCYLLPILFSSPQET